MDSDYVKNYETKFRIVVHGSALSQGENRIEAQYALRELLEARLSKELWESADITQVEVVTY